MKPKQLILIITAIFIISSSLTLIYFSFFRVVKVEKSDYNFKVAKLVGLNADTDAVKFGIVPPGGTGSRHVFFKNDFEFPVKVYIYVKGEKSEWISVSEKNFVLEPYENKTIKFILNPPETTPENKEHIYSGKITARHIKI